jgi:hypothetical protein
MGTSGVRKMRWRMTAEEVRRKVRRLGHAALFAAVRGAGTAVGAAAVAAFTWWVQRL